MSVGEIACTYAALILHDDGISITVIVFTFQFHNFFFLIGTHIFVVMTYVDV